jgi:hypothetical protein
MPASLTRVHQLILALGVSSTVATVALAQSTGVNAAQLQESTASGPDSKPSKRAHADRGWRVAPSLQLDAEYDNNVFLLAPGRKDNVGTPTTAEAISGRYADMKKATDVLTKVSAGLILKGPGLMGKKSLVTSELAYELYTQNTDRSNLSLGLSIQQEAWAESRLRLKGKLTPSYFARNYLAEAFDQDTDGSISDAERVYARGEYREAELAADYRLPLFRSTKKRSFGAALQLGGGYYGRSYDAPLQGRNLRGPTATAKVLLDLGRRVELDLGYDYSSLGADVTNQVLLLNESDFNQDLNGNGSNSDIDARVQSLADRSRKEHSLGATLHVEPSKRIDVMVGYEHRWRRYTSEELLDVANRGRRDTRNQISGDIRFRLSKDLRLRTGGIYSSQNLNRTGDPGSTGEIDDYSRAQAQLGLSYDL